MVRKSGAVMLAVFAAMPYWQARGQAQAGPQPPCAGAPVPPFPDAVGAPVVKVWNQPDWTPPGCVGWAASAASTLVATAGRFRHTSGVAALRHRIGAVSGM